MCKYKYELTIECIKSRINNYSYAFQLNILRD